MLTRRIQRYIAGVAGIVLLLYTALVVTFALAPLPRSVRRAAKHVVPSFLNFRKYRGTRESVLIHMNDDTVCILIAEEVMEKLHDEANRMRARGKSSLADAWEVSVIFGSEEIVFRQTGTRGIYTGEAGYIYSTVDRRIIGRANLSLTNAQIAAELGVVDPVEIRIERMGQTKPIIHFGD